MNSAKWKIIKETFSEVVDLPTAERARFLETADSDVRGEVEKLLFGYENADDFIDRPVLVEQGIAADKNDDLIGEQINDYVIREKIGAGGMGAVYLAERLHSDFKGKVALKLIKRGMDSEAILKRFAVERKILSGLKHPNIAQMIDGGISNEGLPFFVLEFVEGVPLNRFCNENNLTLEEILELFRRICSAVEHAHQNLIVHRDLKPSNILVTADGTPKLLDFGIAKLLSGDDDLAATDTATQGKMFTPEYASPEQILGKTVTTSTDVYSLGVILYEILTQHRPFNIKGKTFEEIVKSVCETDPIAPSEAAWREAETLPYGETGKMRPISTDVSAAHTQRITVSQLRGDLDNIILKALRKEPSERYGSVRHLSEDIARFLNGLPVLARPQTFGYRLEKYIKRHRAGVFAAALILVSLVAGASVAAWQAVEASRQRARAERRFDEVRGLANTILFDHYERIKNLPGATEARAKLVSDALQYLDKLAQESSDNPDLQRELVAAYRKLGEIQGSTSEGGNLGDENAARENYLKALAIQENLAANNSNIEDQRNLGKIYLDVSDLFNKENERPTQAEYVGKGLQIFRNLQTVNPKLTEREADLAKAWWSWAYIVRLQGDNDGAIATYEKAAAIYETLGRGSEETNRYRRNAALTYKNIGAIYAVKKDFQKALDYYQKAYAFDKENAVRAPENVETQMDLSFTHKSLGQAFYELNEKGKALGEYKSAAAIQEKVCNADAQNKFAAKALFRSYVNIADVYRDGGDFAAAEAHYLKSRKMLETVLGKPEKAREKVDMANFFWSYGDFFLKKSQTAAQKSGDLKAAFENLSEAKNIYQTLQNQNILDPAYLENIGLIKESLDKVEIALAGK
jgi:eukaryotic-like serine/threonine-protein kinase